MKTTNYLGYTITPNMTGYVNYDFYLTSDCDALVNHGESINDCKLQIYELYKDNQQNHETTK